MNAKRRESGKETLTHCRRMDGMARIPDLPDIMSFPLLVIIQ
jgi:hypothetical protein